jgi:hypothetical protein
MRICKIYGLDYSLINFVKNELVKNNSTQARDIFNRAKEMLPAVEFDVIDVSDLLYHI